VKVSRGSDGARMSEGEPLDARKGCPWGVAGPYSVAGAEGTWRVSLSLVARVCEYRGRKGPGG
jgi:hypothetical protein